MTKKKRLKFFKHFLFIILISGLLFIHFFVPRLITEIRNPVVGLIKRNHNVSYKINADPFSKIKRKVITVNSFDGFKLSSRITYTNFEEPKGTIILLHGIRSNKNHFIELSELLSKNGFNSVALDSRAHGESEGDFCSFGVNEKKDIQSLISYLIATENLDHFGVWGQSLGGAIGLQAMGYDDRIKYGIIESAFSDITMTVNDYFQLYTGFSVKPFSNYLIKRAGAIAQFDINDAKPLKYCATINQPILLVHGNEDERISFKYAQDNFDKISSSQKELLEIDTAKHADVWNVGGDDYFNKALEFLNTNSK
ncbi:alpha/beta hydrolase [Psychroserpens damuponensis]|uniref:alpha/beta hydrolase n=1 Tax=Psychroserpens damuponensis TaxID=943936 RepID=UPI0013793929|nr:alpha/beta fold hydrolase [Psychroserpens damuponensis]